MEITFMGTGTSQGVPVVGCKCQVCKSKLSKNKRTRSSLWIRHNSQNILIDTATELRLQSLREDLNSLAAILFTHFHADHVGGLDDIRIFNQRQKEAIPCYANSITMKELKVMYSYIFEKTNMGDGKPRLIANTVEEQSFNLFGLLIEPIPVYHGKLPILGYKFNNIAYITDCSLITNDSLQKLYNLDLLILGVLRYRVHPTHFNVNEALDLIKELKPERTLFTHISHELDHNLLNRELPPRVALAYDGLSISF
ncbi:MBL fold metallo-hydrolase [Fuchsiella alkaliacetigena]|nr:MBL fold metallo-hydrolase [Fuchsiella alkaliacetigena]